MSKDSNDPTETPKVDREVSRRDLLGAATLVAGGVAALSLTGQSALALTSDVSVDSLGRITVKGVVVGSESGKTPAAGEIREAKPQFLDFRCNKDRKCSIHDRNCTNKLKENPTNVPANTPNRAKRQPSG